MLNVSRPTVVDAVRSCGEIASLGEGAGSLEEVARRIVRFFHERLVSADATRCCALARFYKMHSYAQLNEIRWRFASMLQPPGAPPDTPCLTLLATAGDEPAWCEPARSAAHLAIPLPSAEVVARMPMLARFLAQLGVQPGAVLAPEEEQIKELTKRALDVFHVEEAHGSPFIPAQREFVEPYGIRSVVGFGGVLPEGELFAVLLFSRAPVPEGMRPTFRTLALAVKLAALPYASGPIFVEDAEQVEPSERPESPELDAAGLRARLAAVEAILAEQTHALIEQAGAIERLVARREDEVGETLSQLEGAVRALSAPVLQVWDGVLAVPLVGALDALGGAALTERLLAEVVRTQSQAVILDATGIEALDAIAAEQLVRVLQAARLLGARCILTGLGPAMAHGLAGGEIDLGGIRTLRNLREGLRAFVGRGGATQR
jgi:anti-anti-sigma regulatory factor